MNWDLDAQNLNVVNQVPAVYYNLALVPSVLLPVGALTLIYYWKKMTNWTRHPIAKRLAAYTSTTNPTWVHVLREVTSQSLKNFFGYSRLSN